MGSHEANAFLDRLGFRIVDLSTAKIDEDSYTPHADKAPELRNYLVKKYSITLDKAKGFRSGLVLPSGATIQCLSYKDWLESL